MGKDFGGVLERQSIPLSRRVKDMATRDTASSPAAGESILESVLTTEDDFIRRGASVAERVAVGSSRILAKLAAGNLKACTTAELKTLLAYIASDIGVSELAGATYDDVQDYINFFGDRTLLSGGGVTDNGNGTAAIAGGTAWAKSTDSDAAVGRFFDFSADNSVALTNLITNYLYLDYNGGTPQIVVSTSITALGFKQDHIHIATIFRNGTTLHFHEEDAIGIGRINIADMHLLEIRDAERASGLVTSDGGSLALSITSGVVYEGLNRHTTSVDGSTWSTWHYNFGTSSWVEVTEQSTINNTQYNPTGSGTGLATLTANRYAVHWVYVDIDGENLFIVYGQGDYKVNEAEEAQVPSLLPDLAVHYGILIAKIIVQKTQTALTITYPWTTVFTSSFATDHGSLGGLGDNDHTQYIRHALATAANDFLVASGSGVYVKKTLAETLALISPLTTRGDIMFRNATVNTRLAKGAANTLLVMGANDPAWSATLAGLTLTSPTINGTIATTGLIIPAFTLGGSYCAVDGRRG